MKPDGENAYRCSDCGKLMERDETLEEDLQDICDECFGFELKDVLTEDEAREAYDDATVEAHRQAFGEAARDISSVADAAYLVLRDAIVRRATNVGVPALADANADMSAVEVGSNVAPDNDLGTP